jgi:hypothetical protein
MGGFHDEDDEVELELEGADCGATTEYPRRAERANPLISAVLLLAIIAGIGAKRGQGQSSRLLPRLLKTATCAR